MTTGRGASIRHLIPVPLRRVATGVMADHRASSVRRTLAELAGSGHPILAGPWLGEVGFELLYWVPFLRWFATEYGVPRERIVAVSRGGSGAAWYAPFAGRFHDALSFMSADDFRRRNHERSGDQGEQKQLAVAALDADVIRMVRDLERQELPVLHPSMMYRLFAPYWWGHRPLQWVRQFTRFVQFEPPELQLDLPARYTAVKFYFNDCFRDTPENRAFVDRTVRMLAADGPVISLSTGLAVDDHGPCEPDIAAMQAIRSHLRPETNLLVQSAVVAGAHRFVGTYGGFAYLAPLYGVPARSYYSEPGSYSTKHLDLIRDVLHAGDRPDLLELTHVARGVAA
jgi:hypothetical protein